MKKRDVTFLIFILVFFLFLALVTILNSQRIVDFTTSLGETAPQEEFTQNAGWFERNKKFIAVDVIILSIIGIIFIFVFRIRKKFYSLWETDE